MSIEKPPANAKVWKTLMSIEEPPANKPKVHRTLMSLIETGRSLPVEIGRSQPTDGDAASTSVGQDRQILPLKP